MLAADVHVDYQSSFDVDAYADAGCVLLIIKATEGVSYRAKMQRWRDRAHERGLTLGLYHFNRANDPRLEADNFLNHTGGLRDDEFAVADWEADAASWQIQAWLERVESATGRLPILYSGPGWMGDKPTDNLTRWPLWVADYARNDGQLPNRPPGTDRWAPFYDGPGEYPHAGRTIGWQYSDQGSFPGYGGIGDINRFDMTVDAVRRLGGRAGTSTPADPWRDLFVPVLAS